MMYVSVPIDDIGINDLDYCAEESAHVISYEMSKRECDELFDRHVFDEINNKFKLLIDTYETERIFYEALSFCKELLERKGLEKTNFMKGIEKALEYRTYVQLDL